MTYFNEFPTFFSFLVLPRVLRRQEKKKEAEKKTSRTIVSREKFANVTIFLIFAIVKSTTICTVKKPTASLRDPGNARSRYGEVCSNENPTEKQSVETRIEIRCSAFFYRFAIRTPPLHGREYHVRRDIRITECIEHTE